MWRSWRAPRLVDGRIRHSTTCVLGYISRKDDHLTARKYEAVSFLGRASRSPFVDLVFNPRTSAYPHWDAGNPFGATGCDYGVDGNGFSRPRWKAAGKVIELSRDLASRVSIYRKISCGLTDFGKWVLSFLSNVYSVLIMWIVCDSLQARITEYAMDAINCGFQLSAAWCMIAFSRTWKKFSSYYRKWSKRLNYY